PAGADPRGLVPGARHRGDPRGDCRARRGPGGPPGQGRHPRPDEPMGECLARRSRWGSASRQGRLMFSWRLVLAPPGALETVVVHELAHLRVFGHGPRFWALVAGRRPGHLAARAWLRRNSRAIHSALEAWPEDPEQA